jgi:tape measure domain-containing protein
MGNKEWFNAMSLAFAQMYTTGKLQGQDLLQMINAGFNPLIAISEKTGKSVKQLKEEMSKGKHMKIYIA